MTTAIYNPFREIDRLFGLADRLAPSDARWMPMDLYRDKDKFVVKMDLPGVDPSSIDIDVDDRTLTVRAERQAEQVREDDGGKWVTHERSYGAYARQLTLGAGLDLAKIEAQYADGVLTLTIPVAEEAKPRKVEVKAVGQPKEVAGTATESAKES